MADAERKPDKKPKAPPKRTRKATRQMTDALAQLVGIPIAVLSPPDALSPDEQTALSIALYDAASTNDIINTIIVNLTGVGGVGELVAVTGAIAGKRIVSRRINPQQPDMRLVIMASACEVIIKGVVSKEKSEAGTTYPPGGVNRVGQDDHSAEDTQPSPVQHSSVDEAGYADLGLPLADSISGEQVSNNGRKPRMVRAKATPE